MQSKLASGKLSRRGLLSLTAAATALAACSRVPGSNRIVDRATPAPKNPTATPPVISSAASPSSPLAWLLANRIQFGPRSGDLQRIDAIGADAFIDEQLALGPAAAESEALKQNLAALDVLDKEPAALYAVFDRKRVEIVRQMSAAALLRAVYARRQLYEVMVDFWTNHFNIYIAKGNVAYLKPTDDREVIRPHALGNFRDLLAASVKSPAMLMYLDNQANRKDHPDENYARELLELHTVGVDGGYTEQDVAGLSRVLTGWGLVNVGPMTAMTSSAGDFRFNPRQHDTGEKVVMGLRVSGKDGEKEIDRVVEMLYIHPSTARHIATKLARRFVSDAPPASVIEKGERAFIASRGDIKATLGAILHSDEFKQSAGQKVKRPLELIASAARAVDATVEWSPQLGETFRQMGQPLFLWSPPNGFPDVKSAWIESSSLLARWNFALSGMQGTIRGFATDVRKLAGGSDPVDTLSVQLLNATLPATVKEKLRPFAGDPARLAGLLMASPLYQVRG